MAETGDNAPRSSLGIVARGMLMGLAEVVPGVSGGTMAFVTGIYPDLVNSLARFGPSSVGMLRAPQTFYDHHNLRFLLLLAGGMGLGVLAFANVMHYLLAHYQPLVWAFFSGVIAMSVLVIGQGQPRIDLLRYAPLGCLLGLAMLWLPQAQSEAHLVAVFLAGVVAVCAWLLPAISGSFVLLSIGLYDPIIAAVADLDWPILLSLVCGCAVGILAFAKLLAWLMRNHAGAILSLLTGFMLGALPKLWPWQASQTAGIEALLLPGEYQLIHATSALLPGVVICAGLGAVGLLLLNRISIK